MKLGIEASAGIKATLTASHGYDDILDNLPSKHTCTLCVSGEADWFAEVHIKASYDICWFFSGDLFDFEL